MGAKAESSLAQQARALVARSLVGSLSTQSRKGPGWPFGSVMPYAADESGRPVFLISGMAAHTRNLADDPRASLLIAESGASDPLARPRITLMGNVHTVTDEERQHARELYLSRHPNAGAWAGFGDFGFHRMEVIEAYYIAGFGVMGWISGDDYARAG